MEGHWSKEEAWGKIWGQKAGPKNSWCLLLAGGQLSDMKQSSTECLMHTVKKSVTNGFIQTAFKTTALFCTTDETSVAKTFNLRYKEYKS